MLKILPIIPSRSSQNFHLLQFIVKFTLLCDATAIMQLMQKLIFIYAIQKIMCKIKIFAWDHIVASRNTYLIQNSQAVKKVCGPQKGYGEKRCEIQGGGQEMAVMVG